MTREHDARDSLFSFVMFEFRPRRDKRALEFVCDDGVEGAQRHRDGQRNAAQVLYCSANENDWQKSWGWRKSLVWDGGTFVQDDLTCRKVGLNEFGFRLDWAGSELGLVRAGGRARDSGIEKTGLSQSMCVLCAVGIRGGLAPEQWESKLPSRASPGPQITRAPRTRKVSQAHQVSAMRELRPGKTLSMHTRYRDGADN